MKSVRGVRKGVIGLATAVFAMCNHVVLTPRGGGKRIRGKLVASSVVCLLVTGLLLGFVTSVSEKARAGNWVYTTVESDIDPFTSIGYYSSIAIDQSGNPGISYLKLWSPGSPLPDSSVLKFAKLAGGSWNTEDVDPPAMIPGTLVGQYSSLAFDSLNQPHISYMGPDLSNPTGNLLRHAYWDGGSWRLETVDSSDGTGAFTSIAVADNDVVEISYFDVFNADLKFASRDGSPWNVGIVDPGGMVGTSSSLAIDSLRRPSMSYIDLLNHDLWYTWWDWGSGTWKFVLVDYIGDQSGFGYSSLVLDSKDLPHIAYYYSGVAGYGYAKYAWSDGTSWHYEFIDPVPTELKGMFPSLALDEADIPHMSYWDQSLNVDGVLMYATRIGPDNWDITPVDSGGIFSSLALDSSGYAHMSYMRGDELWYAEETANSAPTVSTPSGPTSGVAGISYPYSFTGDDPDLDSIMFQIDWGDGNVSWTGTWVASGDPEIVNHVWSSPGLYHVKAAARDVHGAMAALSSPLDVTIASPPDAPTGLTAIGGDHQVNLSWTPPVDDGGSPITNYRIYRGTSSGGEGWLNWCVPPTYTDTGLTNGQTYYYKVTAMNKAGEGPLSLEASATPATTPSEPRNLQVAAGNGQTILSWGVPASDGGSPITNYRIHRGTSPGGESFLIEVGNVLTYTDTGLTNGQIYCYKVSAENAAGNGPNSTEASTTPLTTPSAPLNLQAIAGDGQVILTWSAPTSDGGSSIMNYRISRGISPGGESFLIEVGNVLTYTDTGLKNGQIYYYTVAASNSPGSGPDSTEASATPTAPTTPPGERSILGEPWLWIAIAIVIALVVIAALYLMRRKRAKPEQQSPPQGSSKD